MSELLITEQHQAAEEGVVDWSKYDPLGERQGSRVGAMIGVGILAATAALAGVLAIQQKSSEENGSREKDSHADMSTQK